MILNTADNVMFGDIEVSKIYCGNVIVWERKSDPLISEYGLSTTGNIELINAVYVGDPFRVMTTTDNDYFCGGYFTETWFRSMDQGTTGFYSIRCEHYPPMIYIPFSGNCQHYGVSLATNSVYSIVDKDTIYPIFTGVTGRGRGFTAAPRETNSGEIFRWYLGGPMNYVSENLYYSGVCYNQDSVIYHGSSTTVSDWSEYIDSMQNLVGKQLQLG